MKRWSLPVALAVCIFLKFILFDVIWSSDTTFQSFSQPESYLIKGAIALLLAFPTVFFRSRWYAGIVCFLLDILLVANLMYWRTYYTVHIPADTRSAFPVISVHSPVSIQYRWQS